MSRGRLIPPSRVRVRAARITIQIRRLVVISCLGFFAGCANGSRSKAVVFYCDGAGWYSGGPRVQSGLSQAKFDGRFEPFGWSTLLGAGTDHLIAARSDGVARRLTRTIEDYHRKYPFADIHVMGLSAGTAVVLNAIAMLPEDVKVKHVVLLSSSASANHDLTDVMHRVSGYLYNTVSRKDGILSSLAVNADGKDGSPAGATGFRRPRKRSHETISAYRRVVNLPWKPAYLAYDWDGGHVSATSPKFIKSVIAPRIMSNGPFPLDRPMIVVAPSDDGE